jgi:regulator of protease activity HflC (stomatin/prohibitin superfamily)
MLKLICFLSIIYIVSGFYTTVPEGYIGIYRIMGQIDNQIISKLSFYLPIYSDITLVKYIQDTDHVTNVKCVSKEGVDINIPDIEIANKIDKNKIIEMVKQYGFDYDTKLVVKPLAQYMRELCASRTVDQIEIEDFHKLDDLLQTEIQRQVNSIDSGITIDYVRVTSVVVPPQIKDKRLKLAEEKANKILAEEAMKRKEVEKATEALVAKRDNDIKMENTRMENERLMQHAEAERKRKGIENAIILEATQTNVQKIKLEAIANAEKMELEAKGLRELFAIPEYANVKKFEAISDKTEMVYWGNQLPTNVFMGNIPTTN